MRKNNDWTEVVSLNYHSSRNKSERCKQKSDKCNIQKVNITLARISKAFSIVVGLNQESPANSSFSTWRKINIPNLLNEIFINLLNKEKYQNTLIYMRN